MTYAMDLVLTIYERIQDFEDWTIFLSERRRMPIHVTKHFAPSNSFASQ
jgi:hypothetical protein